MEFSEPPHRPRTESIVPMINVVFLLLIFFLMSSSLAAPDPFEINPPIASSDVEPAVDRILYVDKTGRTSFEGAEDATALNKLIAISQTDSVIQVRADAELEARVLAALLEDLAIAGLSRVELVVSAR